MEARSNGAMWRVDGGAVVAERHDRQQRVCREATLVDFKTIRWLAGTRRWKPITLSEGQAMGISRFYSAARGALIVNIDPEERALAGAQWSVDDAGWQNSGATNILSPGNHNVSFRDIPDWTTPASQQVAVVKGQTSVVNVTYQYGVRSVSGTIFNESLWNNRPPRSNPPGDGSGSGRIRGRRVADEHAKPTGRHCTRASWPRTCCPRLVRITCTASTIWSRSRMYLGYQVRAWVDADNNGRYDIGEPASAVHVVLVRRRQRRRDQRDHRR